MGRYRCFLPDLAGFAVFPCAGPGYQRRAFHRGIVAAPFVAAYMLPHTYVTGFGVAACTLPHRRVAGSYVAARALTNHIAGSIVTDHTLLNKHVAGPAVAT